MQREMTTGSADADRSFRDDPEWRARGRCAEGAVELDIEFAPRFEYGLTVPVIHRVDGGAASIATRSGLSSHCGRCQYRTKVLRLAPRQLLEVVAGHGQMTLAYRRAEGGHSARCLQRHASCRGQTFGI